MYWIIGKILGIIVVLYFMYIIERICITNKIPFIGYLKKDSCKEGILRDIETDFEEDGILGLLGDILLLVIGAIIVFVLLNAIIIIIWPVAIPTLFITGIITRKLLNKKNK